MSSATTVASENTATVRALLAAADSRDLDTVASVVTEDIEMVNETTGETVHGIEGLQQVIGFWRAAFPDYRQEIQGTIADDDGVAVEFLFIGTHGGPLPTPDGEIPATGRSVSNRAAAFFHLDGGKVSSYHLYFDVLSLLTQLGVTPGGTSAS